MCALVVGVVISVLLFSVYVTSEWICSVRSLGFKNATGTAYVIEARMFVINSVLPCSGVCFQSQFSFLHHHESTACDS